MDNAAKLEALQNNEGFKQELLNIGTAEELQKTLEKYDVDLTVEEIQELIAKQETEELSEDDLENVAGGSKFLPAALWIIRWIWKNGRLVQILTKRT